MNESTLQERVDRGAAWLDLVYPEWWTHVDLGRLQLADSCRCVLGQVFRATNAHWSDDSGFERIVSLLEHAGMYEQGDGFWTSDHGFSLNETAGSWADLDEAWIATIKARWESGVQLPAVEAPKVETTV